MATTSTVSSPVSDPAAVFGAALSLWNACRRIEGRPEGINLSETYDGMDQFMRVVMKVANVFEEWACRHLVFDESMDVWPYLLEDSFGEACLAEMFVDALTQFDDEACLRIAIRLGLPIKLTADLPVPIDERAANPVSNSLFREFRIQTVRLTGDLESVEPFVTGDDPYDNQFGEPYYGVYGVGKDGLMEHIADRNTYAEAVDLVRKLAPDIEFPRLPRARRWANEALP